MPPRALNPYVSLWKYLDPEPKSLEETIEGIAGQGFGVEYWPHADGLDPYRAGWGDGPVLFDQKYRDRLTGLGPCASWRR